MYISTLTISKRGQIVLPKKIRDILKSKTISLVVNEHNQVAITPMHGIGGSLDFYEKSTPLSFDEIRNQAWKDGISVNKGD